MSPIDWFMQARFGMFIHWGIYSLLRRSVWVMDEEHIPVEEYSKLGGTHHSALVHGGRLEAIAAFADFVGIPCHILR